MTAAIKKIRNGLYEYKTPAAVFSIERNDGQDLSVASVGNWQIQEFNQRESSTNENWYDDFEYGNGEYWCGIEGYRGNYPSKAKAIKDIEKVLAERI